MDKSNPHKQIELMVFGHVADTYYHQHAALHRAEQHRLARSYVTRRPIFRPLRRRLGRWLVMVGTGLQERDAIPARLDTVGQV
jgi:hypothetical protein